MSKNSPSLKLRRSKLRRSSIEGLRLVRVFRPKPSIQNGVFCCFREWRTNGSSSYRAAGGPDWARTSDPALIKRML